MTDTSKELNVGLCTSGNYRIQIYCKNETSYTVKRWTYGVDKVTKILEYDMIDEESTIALIECYCRTDTSLPVITIDNGIVPLFDGYRYLGDHTADKKHEAISNFMSVFRSFLRALRGIEGLKIIKS